MLLHTSEVYGVTVSLYRYNTEERLPVPMATSSALPQDYILTSCRCSLVV